MLKSYDLRFKNCQIIAKNINNFKKKFQILLQKIQNEGNRFFKKKIIKIHIVLFYLIGKQLMPMILQDHYKSKNTVSILFPNRNLKGLVFIKKYI